MKEQKTFYKNLYSSKVSVSEVEYKRFLENRNILPLENEVSLSCEGPVIEYEVTKVIKNMKNNKTPGTDGFSVELYKVFWPDINKILIKSFNEAFKKGSLSITQKQSIITCIPKGNKPREFYE